MTLLKDVVDVLRRQGTPHALIGAAAMAVHGVSRSTADVDLLTVDPSILRSDLWAPLEARGRDQAALRAEVERALPEVGAEASRLWARLKAETWT